MALFDNITFGSGAAVENAASDLTGDLSPYWLPADQADAQAVAWSVPSVDPGTGQTAPYWQQLMTYGITRAIDNQFGPPPAYGNTSPGSFAGQNGRTYQQTAVPTQPRAGVFAAADASSGGGLGLLLLAGAAALVAGG